MIKRYNQSKRLSEAVIYNGVAYLCGQCCHEGNEEKKDVKVQTKEALENIERVLADIGSNKTKILSATIYLKDIRYFDHMNEIWDNWVIEGYAPARACVEAALAEKELLVEIVVTAAV
ncbi:RidA family protein [Fusobacterium sp. MFO224]|uniref:RidA family protein n=1 Tax=Fusobacterium sp. MFO224 TaxID=3378070 RepID=UPI0038527690